MHTGNNSKRFSVHEFISPEHVLKALAQFTGTLTSANSKYDRYKKGTASYYRAGRKWLPVIPYALQ